MNDLPRLILKKAVNAYDVGIPVEGDNTQHRWKYRCTVWQKLNLFGFDQRGKYVSSKAI